MGLGRILKASLLAALAVVAKLSGTSAAGNPTGVTNAADDVKWEGGAAPNPADVEVVNPLLRGGRAMQAPSDSNHTNSTSDSQPDNAGNRQIVTWAVFGFLGGVAALATICNRICRKSEVVVHTRGAEEGANALYALAEKSKDARDESAKKYDKTGTLKVLPNSTALLGSATKPNLRRPSAFDENTPSTAPGVVPEGGTRLAKGNRSAAEGKERALIGGMGTVRRPGQPKAGGR